MQGKKIYQEKLFTNFQLSGHIPAGNFYRRLKEALPMQWLYRATRDYYGSEGHQSIDPIVFFKLTLVGYLENLCSDRRITNVAALRLDILYFIGYDIDEPLPWHSTLSRTRQLYGEDVFKQLFRKVLSLCIDKGMVAGRRQAIDSVAVKANASMESLAKKEILEDADNYIGELGDNADTGDTEQKEAVTIDVKKGSRRDVPLGGHINNAYLQSTTDPDARVSVKPGKARRLNYLAQVSVDTASHVITHIQGDHADRKDSQCLPTVVCGAMANLEENGLHIGEVLADTNYSSAEALSLLEQKGIEGYIPNMGQYKPTREGFEYEKGNDRFRCSQGRYLGAKNIRGSHGREKKMQQYRSSQKDCERCPIRHQCIGGGKFKTIAVTVDRELFERMQERLQTHKGRRMKKLRSSTVEPVLGTLVNYLGMGRVNTKGIKQANKCMMMAALAYNLKKLLKWKSSKAEAMVKSLPKRVKIRLFTTSYPNMNRMVRIIQENLFVIGR